MPRSTTLPTLFYSAIRCARPSIEQSHPALLPTSCEPRGRCSSAACRMERITASLRVRLLGWSWRAKLPCSWECRDAWCRYSQECVRVLAARPRFCALSNQKLLGFGVDMPTWKTAVSATCASATRSRQLDVEHESPNQRSPSAHRHPLSPFQDDFSMPFSFLPTAVPGVIIIEPKVFSDDRGFFMETYKRSDLASTGSRPGSFRKIIPDPVQGHAARADRGSARAESTREAGPGNRQ